MIMSETPGQMLQRVGIDGRKWAIEFVETFANHPNIANDEATMTGWFANAIMAGWDEKARRDRKVIDDLHKPFKIYQECGHDHNEVEGVGLVVVEDVGEVCEEGYMYSICRECCCGGADYQSEDCASYHDHGKDKPICKTAGALS